MRLHRLFHRAFSSRTPIAEGLYSARLPGFGNALFTSQPVPVGELLLTEAEPIAWCAPATALGFACEHCLGPLTPAPTPSPSGASLYCCPACQASHWEAGGHSLLDGGMAALNAWCAKEGMNFPRMAAYTLARSLSGGRDFAGFWKGVNGLCYATPPPLEEHPRAYREGYQLVRQALLEAGALKGEGVESFFKLVFNQVTYARLMGTLRLNSFSVPCPMGVAVEAVAAPVPAAVEPACEPSSCGTSDSACSTSSGGCGESAAALGEAPGGTALYRLASLANHCCEPSADVVIARGGALALRARTPLQAGQEVTITYLDSSLPYAFRARRLQLGYGFTCKCARCQRKE